MSAKGGIDIAAILRQLPDQLVLSIELPHLARAKEFGYAEHAARCIETAKYVGEPCSTELSPPSHGTPGKTFVRKT